MRFAVNYSQPGAELWQRGKIQVDCFKCPAWPELIEELHGIYPIYVHFPLRVGKGISNAIDTEKNQIPDWTAFELIAQKTQTPFINVHLAPIPEDHINIPPFDLGTKYSELLTGYMVHDIAALTARFGPERIIAENIYSFMGEHPLAAIIPEVVRDVIEDTGCGLLLDISHARQAARELDMDPYDYLAILPLDRLKEIHITGIQLFNNYWFQKIQDAGVMIDNLSQYHNQLLDHLPMVEEDWQFFQWVLEQIREGKWQEPDIVAFEYGGIGHGFFRATTDEYVLASQVPRLYNMIHNI